MPDPAQRLAFAAALALGLSCLGASAQDEIAHRVQAGDTLAALARHYLDAPGRWPELAARNQVANPRRLVPGSLLTIPAGLLPAASARVEFVHGQASHAHGAGGASAPLQAGGELAEGERITVAPGGFVTVRLVDGTLVRVQADSALALRQLRRRGRAGSAQSVLELERGGVESTVAPRQDKPRHFEIRTPQSSASVRGTQFGVALSPDGRTLTSVTEGAVAVHAAGAALADTGASVAAGQGLVAGGGRLGPVQALLPAPDLSALPERFEDATWLDLALAPLAQAAAYQVEIARDAQFTQVLASARSAAPALRLAALADGSYHLKVRALDAQGLPGQPAQRALVVKAHPIAPLYQSAPGATLERTSGQLVCSSVVGAARYRLQVAADAGFATPLLDHQGTHCAAPLAALAPGRYQWRAASIRVLADGRPDQGPFAQPQSVVVANAPTALAAQALQLRAQGDAQALHWPAEQGQRFRLQVARTPDFAQPLVDEELATAHWSAHALAPGSYFVRLLTRAPSGLESGFSAPRGFRVQAAVQSGTGLPVTSSDGQPLAR